MIIGKVDPELGLPVVDVAVKDSGGFEHIYPMIVDTGCSFEVMLPRPMIYELGLESKGTTSYTTGKGDSGPKPTYPLMVEWDDAWIEIEAVEHDGPPLAGMKLCDGYKIMVEVKKSGRVVIDRLIEHDPKIQTP